MSATRIKLIEKPVAYFTNVKIFLFLKLLAAVSLGLVTKRIKPIIIYIIANVKVYTEAEFNTASIEPSSEKISNNVANSILLSSLNINQVELLAKVSVSPVINSVNMTMKTFGAISIPIEAMILAIGVPVRVVPIENPPITRMLHIRMLIA